MRQRVMRQRILIVALISVLAVAAIAVLGGTGVTAQEPDRPDTTTDAAGTAFTYQGRLTDEGGNPLSGQYDFQFRLYDGSGDDAGQVGSAITVNDKQVDDGRFAVKLDFGGDVFTGDARWLEVWVRETGSDAFTQLLPRQELTPTPYALRAQQAPWSGINGVPADLADGDDDTTYSAGAGLSLSGGAFSVDFNAVARSGHDHLGQTWTGDDNPLVLTGTFGSAADFTPLVLGNAAGDGLHVASTSRHGVEVESAGAHGLHISQSGSDGFRVDDAGTSGVFVESSGVDGLRVRSPGRHGLHVESAGSDGVLVDSAVDDGVDVASAGHNGVEVGSTGDDGVYVNFAGDNGVHVNSAEDRGLYVGSTGDIGIYVAFAGKHGLYVHEADDDGVYVNRADADDDGTGDAGYFNGDVTVTGNLSKGSGSFRIDHPQDPENMTLSHSFVESPEMMNVYNGNVTTDGEGFATVTLPDYFEALNTDYRYQLTVIGTFAQAIIAEEIEGNQFVIQTDAPHVKVSWQVTGVRDDPYAQANPIVVEEEKPAHERGLYLHPEAYGLPPEMGIGYARGENQ